MIEDFYQYTPYELEKEEKEALLVKELTELTLFHTQHCELYQKILYFLKLFYSQLFSKVI